MHATKSYSGETLDLALRQVEKGKSIYATSKELSIPYETLRRWVVKRPTHLGEGRKTYLTFEEENCIVEALLFLGTCGIPIDIKYVFNLVETYFQTYKKRKNPFPNGKSGIYLVRGFEKR